MYKKFKKDYSFSFDKETGEFIVGKKQEEAILPLEIIYLKSDRNILVDETPAILSWEVHNADTVMINEKSVAHQGSMSFHALEAQKVVLIAKNKRDETVKKSIFIDIDKTRPVINFFKADKAFIIKGYPIKLSWDVAGAKKISINNDIGDVSNLSQIIINPTVNGVYTLVAKNYFDFESQETISFTMFPSPVIENLYIPKPELDLKEISLGAPTFNLCAKVNTNIVVTQPVFTQLIEFAQIDTLSTKILLKKRTINSILFHNNIFKILNKKQREIDHIIKMIWKKKIRKNLKRVM